MPHPQNPRLAMDGRMLVARPGGVATYARALRRAQAAIAPDSAVVRDDSPSDGAGAESFDRLPRWGNALLPGARMTTRRVDPTGGEVIHARDLFRLAQVHFDIYGRLLRLRVDGPPGVMHWSYPVPLRIDGWANLYTIHDAIPLLHPELTSIAPRRHRRLLTAIAARATALVTISRAARDDIAAALALPTDRIVDCGQGVAPAPVPSHPLPAGLDMDRYLLVCGSVEPRKNIARLLDAYRRSGVALPLVICGPRGWRGAAIEAEIAATPGAIRMPDVPAGMLASLTAHARMLLMPSLAEGFGLPVAEAMALGTPVITSHRGALAETAGGAALLVDPEDTLALAAAMTRLVADDALRGTLRARGLVNAARFAPDRFAARLDALYAQVAPPR